mgnify:CR=1 FL=1
MVNLLGKQGLAILNADNPEVLKLKNNTPAEVITYGFSENSDIRATDISFNYEEENIRGLSFKLNYKGTTLPIRLNGVLARHQIYAALSAAATGIYFGINLVEIGKNLEKFVSPCSRMNLLPGIKKTLIIDDTYNSSPKSAIAALETLSEIKAPRKIVVLGDMLELGEKTEEGHQAVARKFLETKAHLFFAVGRRMQIAVSELHQQGFNKNLFYYFKDPISAGKKLQEIIQEGDLILIKGSQGMRMEKIVEEIMAEPQKAKELLCRQNKEWKEKEFKEI